LSESERFLSTGTNTGGDEPRRYFSCNASSEGAGFIPARKGFTIESTQRQIAKIEHPMLKCRLKNQIIKMGSIK
jgi:hypothetical protein